ncbi:MBL fold metallo-hydrolase [Streptomyces sp. NPDC017941]|uniref:MBL fold metallo-hydrolase n=1 Tax=unclassified Streptomyces TaxID=2593676 RepID=UPI0037A9A8D2
MDLPVDLTVLADDSLYLWAPRGAAGSWGLANCLLVTSGSSGGHGSPGGSGSSRTSAAEAALIDTPYDARMTKALIAAAGRVLPEGARVRTVVNTHANGDHCFGNGFFPGAEVISTEASLERHRCGEISPQEMQHLVHASDPREPLGWYARDRFGAYDYTGITVVPPTLTFSGTHDFLVGDTEVRLIEVGPAHTSGDLIAHLPQHGVVAAGDVIFSGDHPAHWEGPLAEVVRACETVLALDPRWIVPGHGALMGQDDVRAYIGYLRDLEGEIAERHGRGLGAYEAACDILAAGFHPHLGAPERVVMLTFIEYHHLGGTGAALGMAELAGHAARWAHARQGVPSGA